MADAGGTVKWEPPEGCVGWRRSPNENELLYATMMVSCATLMRKGLDFDTACGVVDSAMEHGDIHLQWTEADGLSLTIGEGIEAQTGRQVDRSAGRWCEVCQQHGDHHTDRHPQLMPVDRTDNDG